MKSLQHDHVLDLDHYTGKYKDADHEFCDVKAHQMFFGRTNIPCSTENILFFTTQIAAIDSSGGVHEIIFIPVSFIENR